MFSLKSIELLVCVLVAYIVNRNIDLVQCPFREQLQHEGGGQADGRVHASKSMCALVNVGKQTAYAHLLLVVRATQITPYKDLVAHAGMITHTR
jgi:hypothetical protein